MPTVKLTKNELKQQKDQLKRFTRYLPTLQLKKQQLQMVIRDVTRKANELRIKKENLYQQIYTWIDVFGENPLLGKSEKLEALIIVEEISRHQSNIAGVNIPVFDGLKFRNISYDLVKTPLWIDAASEMLKNMAELDAEIDILERQIELLGHELRITSQRVNLFEKVKIPETKEHIRKIRIYLGDQQTAAVVRGKIAKIKLDKVS
ncbi:MAG: V-type ATP synthase subunit D [Spirochaetales bacterium]|nr:V-type ATP synthase subunit D [Spirochaetales bacterium]